MILAYLDIAATIASYVIGIIGVTVIVIGALRGFYQYLTRFRSHRFPTVRSTLTYHLVLGLDFLIGKDVIDTFLLHANNNTTEAKLIYQELATLLVVVAIRIVLSFFLEKEIETLEHNNHNHHHNKKKHPHAKPL